MRKFNRADSNRGGALLSVIIAMTVVGILGTLVLSMSYTNFKMKQVDKKSTDNFYSAEAVLDEICVGLQKVISVQYGKAYQTVMENYGYYTTSAEMTEDFNLEFVLNMVEELQTGAVVVTEDEALNQGEYKYDVEDLLSYVNPGNYSGAKITVNNVLLGAAAGESTPTTNNDMDTLTDGLILRNIVVTYENKGYVDTISTDIRITIPTIQFARIAAMPEIADYVTIAQKGVELTGASVWKLQGKAFAGSGIKVPLAAQLRVEDTAATVLITEGDVDVNAGSTFTTSSNTTLWAKSVTASGGSNNVSVLGRTYVQDDTTVSGSANRLAIGGQYYGYNNNDVDAAGSSAIIINGGNTTLDMSSLNTLVLAGTSFVGTKAAADATGTTASMNTSNVLMGDSVAVKGNQIAYLLPTECKGVASNPMSYDEIAPIYADEAAWEQWKKDALDTTIPALGKPLSSYGYISIQPIFKPRTNEVYLYLSFTDSTAASQYFMDYYGSEGGKKIKMYLDRYVSTFTFRSDENGDPVELNRLVTQGNYLIPDKSTTVATDATYAAGTADVATFAQELVNYQSTYEALCTKLVENKAALSSTELSRTVYENLIDHKWSANDAGKLDLFLESFDATGYTPSANMSHKTITNATNGSSIEVVTIWASETEKTEAENIEAGDGIADNLRCIIVDNDDEGDKAYTVPAGGKGIIIATGDVYVPKSSGTLWTGVIICNGKLTLDGGNVEQTLRSSSDVVSTVMGFTGSFTTPNADPAQPPVTVGEYAVMNFFVGNSEYTVGESSDAAGAKVDVRDCLSFENWKSE